MIHATIADECAEICMVKMDDRFQKTDSTYGLIKVYGGSWKYDENDIVSTEQFVWRELILER